MTTNEKREPRPTCPKCAGFLMTGCDLCGDGLVAITRMESYQKARQSNPGHQRDSSGDGQAKRQD